MNCINLIQVLHYADSKASGLQVTISDSVADVRPYIICCVLRNLSLDKTETMFKQFIALQVEAITPLAVNTDK